MPPKNKGNSKSSTAKTKTKAPTLIDGLTKEEMSKDQLKEHIVRLREELDREREERNYFQLERDKIQTFWEVTKRQLEEAKAEVKNLDKDMEEDERRHQAEIKVYRQKMKHLLCEHQNMISELKADGLASSEVAQKEQQQLEAKLHNDKKPIVVDIQELDNESLVKELEQKHEEEMAENRNLWEKKVTETEAKYEEKMAQLLQELDKMKKNEFSEREAHWTNHITALIEQQKKVFSEAHEIARGMQERNAESKLLEMKAEKINSEVTLQKKDLMSVLQDNKRLAGSVAGAEKEVNKLEKKIANNLLTKEEVIAKVKLKELSDLKRNHEVLEQKFSKLQLERDELYKTHTLNIERVQHKAEEKSELLEKKLESLTDNVERTQAQLSAVLSAPNVDQTALCEIAERMEKKIDSSNNTIKDLQYKKAQISKARKDLLLAYEAKQRALGVPAEELSAKPF